jgi:hypothetical protein
MHNRTIRLNLKQKLLCRTVCNLNKKAMRWGEYSCTYRFRIGGTGVLPKWVLFYMHKHSSVIRKDLTVNPIKLLTNSLNIQHAYLLQFTQFSAAITFLFVSKPLMYTEVTFPILTADTNVQEICSPVLPEAGSVV